MFSDNIGTGKVPTFISFPVAEKNYSVKNNSGEEGFLELPVPRRSQSIITEKSEQQKPEPTTHIMSIVKCKEQ